MKRFSFYSLFFKDDQQRKWFVIFSVLLPLFLTIIFSVWGTILSVKSYNLSVETSNNREQLDTMKVMIEELHVQNKLLIEQNKLVATQIKQLSEIAKIGEYSSDIQGMHLATYINSINDSKIPRLAIKKVDYDLSSDSQSDFIEYYSAELVNYGGGILNLKYKRIDSVSFDLGNLPSNGSIPANSNLDLVFKNPFLNVKKNTLKLRFNYEDALHSKYVQDLTLIESKDGVEFQLGKMIAQ